MSEITVDWFRVIADLKRVGYSRRMIAKTIGDIDHSTVTRWYNGSEPGYTHGKRLIDLWIDQTKQQTPQMTTRIRMVRIVNS